MLRGRVVVHGHGRKPPPVTLSADMLQSTSGAIWEKPWLHCGGGWPHGDVPIMHRVWVAARLDIARHWIRTHPSDGGYRPSRMLRALLIEIFGDTFANTPMIAGRAHRAGLSAHDDTADGLHATLMGVVRAMDRDETLALIRVYPELAGHGSDLESGISAAIVQIGDITQARLASKFEES
jgi:hypothetical protein